MALYDVFIPDSLKAPEARTGDSLVDYLIEHPNAKGNFDFRTVDSGQLARLLSVCPRFADRCSLRKITRGDATAIVAAQPDLISRFPLKHLDWGVLLSRRPELVKDRWSAPISRADWITILCHQPQLWRYSWIREFDSGEWSRLVTFQPTFAEKCPWQELNYVPDWNECLFLYPELVLSHRKDWKPYRSQGYRPEFVAQLLARDPSLAEKVDFSFFGSEDWKVILKAQPQFIEKCDVGKIFPQLPLDLLAERPELAGFFDWSKTKDVRIHLLPRGRESFVKFVRTQPQLAGRLLKKCDMPEWEYLLTKHPEYILDHRGGFFSFTRIHDIKVLLLAQVLDIDRTGLDPICNNVYDRLLKEQERPMGWFDTPGDFSPAEFLIRSVMDFANARLYFLRAICGPDWKFVLNVLGYDPEGAYRFLEHGKFGFLLCFAAPEEAWAKYLDIDRENVAGLRDENGNTLLHAALLRATMVHVEAMLDANSPERKLYDELVRMGCDPERKNDRGFSCSDLLVMLSNRVEQLTEKACKSPIL
ncbi:MAG: hypothetical protein IJT50_09815 [Lentisphaeria bacterium]|nr:hypothetical protein [Lentisphaeria bacterium]